MARQGVTASWPSTSHRRRRKPSFLEAPASFIRIDETESASIAFNQIDRNKVLPAVRRCNPGRSSFAVIIAIRRHLFSVLIIDTYGDSRRFGGRSRKPILVPGIKING